MSTDLVLTVLQRFAPAHVAKRIEKQLQTPDPSQLKEISANISFLGKCIANFRRSGCFPMELTAELRARLYFMIRTAEIRFFSSNSDGRGTFSSIHFSFVLNTPEGLSVHIYVEDEVDLIDGDDKNGPLFRRLNEGADNAAYSLLHPLKPKTILASEMHLTEQLLSFFLDKVMLEGSWGERMTRHDDYYGSDKEDAGDKEAEDKSSEDD